MSDPSASTWDQQTKTTKAAGIPEIMTAQGMKYYSLLDPASLLDSALEVVTNDGACNSLCGLPFQSELEMRQSLEESAMYLRDLVKAIDSDYGVSKALANGTEPTVPESVSSLHYSVHTKYKETRANAEWASLRDSVQFVGQWCGICDGILWQYVALWVGYLTHTDDLCIPPWDVENGTYQYHGLTPRNILDMLCKLGPENAASWKPYLWDAMMRGVWIQYLEKTGAAFSESIPQANGSDIERDILKKCQTGGMVMCTIETPEKSQGVQEASIHKICTTIFGTQSTLTTGVTHYLDAFDNPHKRKETTRPTACRIQRPSLPPSDTPPHHCCKRSSKTIQIIP
ncbi:hypothetical protein BGZ90_000520 [Linnemannia elongata]|nr:hypothetical protein BGZ90_000520 [Linnemannia elongata]